MISQGAPQEINREADSVAVMAAVADNLRYLLTRLGLYGAPWAVVILISAIPRAQLSDAYLAAFRELAGVKRGVAREFDPAAPSWMSNHSWRRTCRRRGAGAVASPVMAWRPRC